LIALFVKERVRFSRPASRLTEGQLPVERKNFTFRVRFFWLPRDAAPFQAREAGTRRKLRCIRKCARTRSANTRIVILWLHE